MNSGGDMSKGRVLLAAPRGSCAGVARAVSAVEKAIGLYGPPVYVRKQIVHNSHVVAALVQRGAVFVEEIDEVPPGATLIFSAHGVAPAVRSRAQQRGLRTIDATCPLVAKIHREATRFADAGYEIMLIGEAGHDEVTGTVGHAPGQVHVVGGPGDAAAVKVGDPAKVAWVSQTTLSMAETQATLSALRERFPQLLDPPSDDICYAVQNRQKAVKQIAAMSDLVVVVGSANSHNSAVLAEVAREAGARAHLVDHAGDIDENWLDGTDVVGLTGGASAPEILVQDVLAWLASRGFDNVEEISVTQEDASFALPRELARQYRPSQILAHEQPSLDHDHLW
jgi:4-hydroxy-3-methylbut-2-enyl diphosphate reductase